MLAALTQNQWPQEVQDYLVILSCSTSKVLVVDVLFGQDAVQRGSVYKNSLRARGITAFMYSVARVCPMATVTWKPSSKQTGISDEVTIDYKTDEVASVVDPRRQHICFGSTSSRLLSSRPPWQQRGLWTSIQEHPRALCSLVGNDLLYSRGAVY